MIPILCISFPNHIITGIKLENPSLYESCCFAEQIVNSESYAIIILPVEFYIFQITSLSRPTTKIIAYGKKDFLEEAFFLGAEDYLKDPWDHSELIIRLDKIFSSQIIQNDLNQIEMTQAGIRVNDELFRLSKREIKILTLLNSNRNSIVSYKALAEYIGIKTGNYENTLYVTISNLRKKLKEIGSLSFPDLFDIENISSMGYLFKTPVDNLCKNKKKSKISL